MGTRIPLSLLRDLKCRHCKNFLSCGPVYVTPDCGLLCGRCRALAKPNFRNYVYEELANSFVFPCLNWENHCSEEGPWNTLKEHEFDCPYGSSCRTLCTDPAAFFSSKRILPNEENLLYLEVPEKCLNLVSCKNCGKYLSSHPVHINASGSNICHRCYLSNGSPPNTLRNLAYEKLANVFRFPCIFRARGCPIKFKFGRDSWEHEVNCHYKNVQMYHPSPTLETDQSRIQHDLDLDDSGYRPSVEGDFFRFSTTSREMPKIELPRVSSILRNQSFGKESRQQQRRKDDKEYSSRQMRETNHNLIQPPRIETPDRPSEWERKENNNPEPNRPRIADKERGIVPTHTGHVYATLTKSPVLFAPPQIQPNKDTNNGRQVTNEFQAKIMRTPSNVSQSGSLVQERIRNSLVSSYEARGAENGTRGMNTVGIPSPPVVARQNFEGFSGMNKSYVRDLGNFNEEYAPVVKEYVQFNPNNNVQRNESLTIGNADIIAELKMKNLERMKKRQFEEDRGRIGMV